MAEDARPKADDSAVMQFMTTEHFTLQTARAATIADASGRASLFLSTVSGALVAIAFIGQVSNLGTAFYIFALVLLPSLVFLGVVTCVRVLETSIEDSIYARGINRIRHYYLDQAPHVTPYFILSAYDDDTGVMRNMGFGPSRGQIFFTTAGMISVINSVLVGVFVGLLLHVAVGFGILPNVIGGAGAFILSGIAHYRYQVVQWGSADRRLTVRFPSPTDGTW